MKQAVRVLRRQPHEETTALYPNFHLAYIVVPLAPQRDAEDMQNVRDSVYPGSFAYSFPDFRLGVVQIFTHHNRVLQNADAPKSALRRVQLQDDGRLWQIDVTYQLPHVINSQLMRAHANGLFPIGGAAERFTNNGYSVTRVRRTYPTSCGGLKTLVEFHESGINRRIDLPWTGKKPYAPSTTPSTMSYTPVVRQISWPAVLPQLAALGGAMAIGVYVMPTSNGIILGAAAYLTYSIGSRTLIARYHRWGMRLCRNQQYAAAIQAYEKSYELFARNAWIDRFRAVIMMSPSAISYREMALCNIAFCYSQLGDGEKARSYYRQALDEFPCSGLAAAALRLIESVRPQPTEPTNGK